MIHLPLPLMFLIGYFLFDCVLLLVWMIAVEVVGRRRGDAKAAAYADGL